MLTFLEDVLPVSSPSEVVNTAVCLKGTWGIGLLHVRLALKGVSQSPIAVSHTNIVDQESTCRE